MGLSQAHALGRQQRVFLVDEGATPNVLAKATAASALRVKACSIKETTPRENRMDARDTRSRTERITRAKEVEWSLSAYMLTGMDPGDIVSRLHPLLRALFGGYTNTAGTSDLYTLTATQVARALSITRQPLEGRVQEIAIGCVVNQGTFSLSQGDEPSAEFSGPGLRYAQAIGQTTTATVGAGTTKTLATVEGLTVDSVVAFSNSDGSSERNNTGAGYRITAINGAVITIETSDTSASGNLVYPYTPTPTNVGIPIAGILGSLTLDAVACPIKSFSLTINNNNSVITEALESGASDHVFGDRDVTGTLTIRGRADLLRHFALRRTFTARGLVVTCGAAGNRWTFTLPTIEVDATGELNLPVGSEEGDFELPFVALGTENEITLTID